MKREEVKSLIEILRHEHKDNFLKSDLVIRECRFDILINGERLVSLATIPEYLAELGWGYLFSEGLIQDRSEILDHDFELAERKIDFKLNIPQERIADFFSSGEKTSGCGSSLSAGISGEVDKFPSLTIRRNELFLWLKDLFSDALFRETGGVHLAGLMNKHGIKYRAADIGRHNAVDKIAGMALLQNENLMDFMLISTGRISSEIVRKSIRLGFPLIISRSAPTSEAIRLAWKHKIYLIGFARAGNFNLYTGLSSGRLEII